MERVLFLDVRNTPFVFCVSVPGRLEPLSRLVWSAGRLYGPVRAPIMIVPLHAANVPTTSHFARLHHRFHRTSS